MSDGIETLLTSKEASRVLKIHPKVLERMAKRGEGRICPSSGQGTLEWGKIVNLYEVVLGEFDVSG